MNNTFCFIYRMITEFSRVSRQLHAVTSAVVVVLRIFFFCLEFILLWTKTFSEYITSKTTLLRSVLRTCAFPPRSVMFLHLMCITHYTYMIVIAHNNNNVYNDLQIVRIKLLHTTARISHTRQ